MRVLFFVKFECCRINAVTFSGGGRAVVENVPQVGTASGTKYFHSLHTKAVVGFQPHIQVRDRLVVARPSCPRFKFGGTAEKVGTTAYTLEDAWLVDFFKEAGAGKFRSLPRGDIILLPGQQLLPFRIRLLYFLYGYFFIQLCIKNLYIGNVRISFWLYSSPILL
jgi:hypothetical protein